MICHRHPIEKLPPFYVMEPTEEKRFYLFYTRSCDCRNSTNAGLLSRPVNHYHAFMKRLLISSLIMLLAVTLLAQNKSSAVPKKMVGHWQLGSFSLTNFWNPTTGQYVGNAGEASRSYKIAADGYAEEFFIYNSASYNCRTQVLGYRKGMLKFSADGSSFSFCPASGFYRSANCFKKDWVKKEYGEKDLCPVYQVTYYWKVENGNLVVRDSPGATAVTTYKRIDASQK
jgi:hypothetical protein